MTGQEYTINEVVNGTIVNTTKSVLETVWETDFSSEPSGIEYSVGQGANLDISSGILYYHQGGGSGERAINMAFTDEKFRVMDACWVMEFDWGASSSNTNASFVSFATNENVVFTINWNSYATDATINDADGKVLTAALPIDGYNKPEMTVLSHFTIIGDRNNAIYLTVTYNGTTYVDNVKVSSKFGYPSTFNGTLGRTVSHMALDNIKFSTYKSPYHYYNVLNETLYYTNATNSGYNYLIPWLNSKTGEVNIEYKEKKTAIDTPVDRVVYFSEAEDIKELTLCTSTNMYSRSSNGAAAYAADGNVEIAKLDKGSYLLTAVIFDSSKNPDSYWPFYAGDEEIANLHCTTVNFQEVTSYAFDIETDNTPIYLGQGGSKDRGIDLIYIRRISDTPLNVMKWIDDGVQQAITRANSDANVVKHVTVDISEISNDNRTSKFPSSLLNADNKTIEYASTDESVAIVKDWFDIKDKPQIKKVGSTTFLAKNTDYEFEGNHVDVATYTLTVTGNTDVTGDYDEKTNTYSFNTVGQALNTNTIEIEGVKMTYGDKNSTAVVVKNEKVGPILKVIDANGFSHPNLTGGAIPPDTEYGGTYYKFTPTIDGILTVTGQLSNATVFQYNGSGSPVEVTKDIYGTSMTVSLTKGNTYYLYNGRIESKDNATPLLHSFSYLSDYSIELSYSNIIKADGTPKVDGFAFNNNVKLTPILTVLEKGNPTTAYTANYDIGTDNYLGFNSGTGVLTTAPDEDGRKVTVNVTVSIKGETLKTSFTLMMIKGEWDFSKINEAVSQGSNSKFRNLKTKSYTGTHSTNSSDTFNINDYESPYDNNKDAWTFAPNSNSGVMSRDTKDFEPILYGGRFNPELENEPLDIAMALQTRYFLRWVNGNDKHLYLFGKLNAKTKHGGVIKVPVQKGMVLEINGRSDAENAEMLINKTGLTANTDMAYSAVEDLDGNPVTRFYISETNESYQFIVTTDDDFLYIVDPSFNLPFIINHIKLTNKLVFDYEDETFIDGSFTEFCNPILNASPNEKLDYVISSDEYEICKKDEKISDDGTVQLNGNKYGTYKVKVTGTDGELEGVEGEYTVHVINMTTKDSYSKMAKDGLKWTPTELMELITIEGDGKFAAEELAAFKKKVEFSEIERERGKNIRKVTFTGKTGNQTLFIEGTGTVKIQAKLGCVVRSITFTVTGGALKDRSPVYPASETKANIEVTGDGISDIEFETDWMLENILGELREHSSDLQLQFDEKTKTLTLSRKSADEEEQLPIGYGGAIPIKGSYTYKMERYNLTGVLTIAYSSHIWDFHKNMLLNDHPTYTGIGGFYTNRPSGEIGNYNDVENRLGKWTTTATFDEPVDDETNHSEDHQWRFLRKMGSGHKDSQIVYYYNSSVDGDNATILPETSGLLINSSPDGEQFGVKMEKDNGNPAEPLVFELDTLFNKGKNHYKADEVYRLYDLMLKAGGELVIPCVKPGQWIEMQWYRHKEDLGERMTMANLCDIDGTPITDTYKIGNTEKGTYMFQVDPTLKEKWVDAIFHVSDRTYLEIRQIELHELGWEYKSSMNEKLKQTESGNTKDVEYQYLTNGTPRTIAVANRGVQNAPNASCDWQVRAVGNLDYKVSEDSVYNEYEEVYRSKQYLPDSPTITVNGGWGKIYVTLNSYTQDYKYVANRKTWVITFGEAPAQEYPYTWDFTKYFENTKEKIGTGKYDDVFKEDSVYASQKDINPYGSHEYRIELNTWDETGDKEKVVTEGYNTANYGSFFVNGAQLVGYGLRGDKKYNGRLPETAGLGFMFNNLNDKNNVNDGRLSLDMQSNDAKAVEADNNETWRDGKLSIRGGGSIIVPRPKENAENFCIYLRSSVAPKEVVNANEIVKVTTSIDGEETEKNWLCKYNFAVDKTKELDDAVFTFEGNVEVYAIAVTNKFKTMTALSGTGWATESRDSVIDHTLTGYLTTNPTEAYAIVERYDNPTYSDNKAQTAVALKDRRYVVPANYGIVMKQTKNVPENNKYDVPLFVPAVTTAVDNLDKEEFNLMRPNVKETEFKDETETVSEPNAMNAMGKGYTRFILASRYMTWKRQDEELTKPTGYESGEVAAFYRLHVYGEGESFDGKDAATLNTLPKNSAYLLLRTDKLNPALWGDASNGSRSYIGIEGVSDMFDEPSLQDAQTGAVGIYSLSGQKLNPDSPLAPGIYIINGKKTIVRGNHDQ